MQVRLTKEGQKVLGISGRKIVMVSDARAFALMSGGYAVQDQGFMALFNGSLPEKEKPVEKPKLKLKKETAISQKATKREKAVKK